MAITLTDWLNGQLGPERSGPIFSLVSGLVKSGYGNVPFGVIDLDATYKNNGNIVLTDGKTGNFTPTQLVNLQIDQNLARTQNKIQLVDSNTGNVFQNTTTPTTSGTKTLFTPLQGFDQSIYQDAAKKQAEELVSPYYNTQRDFLNRQYGIAGAQQKTAANRLSQDYDRLLKYAKDDNATRLANISTDFSKAVSRASNIYAQKAALYGAAQLKSNQLFREAANVSTDAEMKDFLRKKAEYELNFSRGKEDLDYNAQKMQLSQDIANKDLERSQLTDTLGTTSSILGADRSKFSAEQAALNNVYNRPTLTTTSQGVNTTVGSGNSTVAKATPPTLAPTITTPVRPDEMMRTPVVFTTPKNKTSSLPTYKLVK